jgi:type III restriction enzyme
VPPTVIENPILNSPYREPNRHFRFDDDGITSEIAEGRRRSTYFVPIPPPKKKPGGAQLVLSADWVAERMQENDFINRVRDHVAGWRQANYPGVTSTTRELLEYWTRPDRERPLFFCQIEALETAIFLTEVAGKEQQWIENTLREEGTKKSGGLYRTAFKMATGSGKTVVMCMLIAWHALNKLNDQTNKRFSDTFLVLTPGITIRDRLRVLQPNAPGNFYRALDLLPDDQLQRLQAVTILITNYHALIRRDKFEAASLTKKVLAGPDGDTDQFKETPDEMVRRVCRALGSKKNIVVFNDEAHHCYQSASQEEAVEEKLSAVERSEAKEAEKAARVWLEGLRAIQRKIGLRAIYDLSATPFFLRGSGYKEGTLFPWVVSDFSLIDAIESGVVKIPRVPVSDDSMTGDSLTYRDLWSRIRDDLPRKGRSTDAIAEGTPIPKELEGALRSLYGNYEKSVTAWEAADAATPPVFIVVCQNTNISKLVFDWIAGYEKPGPASGSVVVPGNLPLFSNEQDGRWRDRPHTLLIDSAQLESGEAMDPVFKKIAAAEIEEYKREYLARSPGSSVDDIEDEDLLREVMNTIGKQGRLGEQLRCVVSVSMLTEGWDANTVTHILGIRAFGTQLLCEQVVGRGLRRVSYEPNADGRFDPEYAEVFGVPFSFIPTTGTGEVKPQPPVHRVHALPDRVDLEISFPRVIGYRWEMPTDRLAVEFNEDSHKALSTQEVPTRTQLDPIVGASIITNLDDLKAFRPQQVAFTLAKRTLDKYFADGDGAPRPWLFPQLLRITNRWLAECVTLKDNAFPQLLILAENSHDAADRIHRAIVVGTAGEKRLLPIMRPFEPIGSTREVDFNTTKAVYATTKSHLNYVVQDSGWESKLGQVLDDMAEVVSYVKNQGLNFRVPYTHEGMPGNYNPDFIVRINDGAEDLLNLIIEVTGEQKPEKKSKVATAQTYWVPAVNNHGEHGRWKFVEVTDPWDAANLIRSIIQQRTTA